MKDVDTTVNVEEKEPTVTVKTVDVKDVKTKKEALKKVKNFLLGFMSGVVVGGTTAVVITKALASKKAN